jgi:alpha-ribazole phosphatase
LTLFLLRHGQTDWNVEPARCQGWQDVGLNETGRAQARARGRALCGRGIELIVASHLRRARETAELVREELLGARAATDTAAGTAAPDAAVLHAATRGAAAARASAAAQPGALPVVVDPRLAETHRGRWESRLYLEIIREEPAAWRTYREHPETFRFPDGESLAEQQLRVLAAVRDAALDGRTPLLITHGGAIRLVRCFLDRRGIEAFHELATSNGGVDEIVGPGLVTRIDAVLGGNP